MIDYPQLIKNIPTIAQVLSGYKKYLSHTSSNFSPEPIEHHFNMVNKYLGLLIDKQSIEDSLNLLISNILKGNNESFYNWVKEFFISGILFHDFGKVNENFQVDKMKNPLFQKLDNGFESGHSKLSVYLYIIYYLQKILNAQNTSSDDDQILLFIIAVYLSYPILKHHSPNLGKPNKEFIELELNSFLGNSKQYLQLYNINCEEEVITNTLNGLENYIENFNSLRNQLEFSLFALIKLHYSLLTSSDYLATSHYMMNWNSLYSDFGLLDNNKKKQIVDYFYNNTTAKYNKDLIEQWDYYSSLQLENLQDKKNENLNNLRQKLATEVIQTIQKNPEQRLFYLEAPTGSGKTNLSMVALVEFLKLDLEKNTNNISKVFYVFPFTTLITQTFSVLKNSLNLDQEDLIELHSKAGFQSKSNEDDVYGTEKLNYIDYLFANYPVCLLSHIKFFDILKGNRKENNYLLYRLANSLVIIDELQSYNPQHWDKIIYFIENYSKFFNIRFILMSATLPKIDKLLKDSKTEFVNLIKNSSEYFQNPNFKDRTQFDFSLQENVKDFNLDILLQEVYNKSKEYSNTNKTNPNSVFTIVEFIFKKTASEFYKLVMEQQEKENFFGEVFVLSGTILEPRRKEIISFLKNPANRTKKVLLLTTQVVEAGVDIDMDLGFKDTSLIDSDEQLAGRINRNVKKDKCKLYLFKYDRASTIYGKDERYKATRDHLDLTIYKEILETKNFSKLYNAVFEKITKWNNNQFAVNLSDYKNKIKDLKFDEVDKDFKLIDNENVSIFVPLSVPVQIPGSIENNFSESEIIFLKNYNKLDDPNAVDGSKVWELYEDIIKNKNLNFIDQKILIKTLQGIMSKFIFSIFSNSQELNSLKAYGEEKYGFIYLKFYSSIYDYSYGINNTTLTNNFF